VHGGSSYLSQSELALTFGVGRADKIERITVDWPNSGTEEYKNLTTGRVYEIIETKGLTG
jgi:enediyne biosynthesis protein E4